jgi:hypothetical protein
MKNEFCNPLKLKIKLMTKILTHDDFIDILEKSSIKFPGINLDKCSTPELEHLVEISNRKKNGIDSSDDRLYIVNLLPELESRYDRFWRPNRVRQTNQNQPVLNNKNKNMAQLTTDKILALRSESVSINIDLHACTNEQIDRLSTIAKNDANRIPRSGNDMLFIKSLQNKGKQEPIGKWSK